MNPNVIAVYSFLALLVVAGIVLSTVHWTLTGACFLLTLTHFMMFVVGRLVECPIENLVAAGNGQKEQQGNGSPAGATASPKVAEPANKRPESLTEKIRRRNREKQGGAQVLVMEDRTIPFNSSSAVLQD